MALTNLSLPFKMASHSKSLGSVPPNAEARVQTTAVLSREAESTRSVVGEAMARTWEGRDGTDERMGLDRVSVDLRQLDERSRTSTADR